MNYHLALIDESFDTSKIIHKLRQLQKTKIISFDIKSHNILSNFEIQHEKIEDYLNSDDQQLIDKLTISMASSWYKDKHISQYTQYSNLNLGYLLELEILLYFRTILKTFLGIIKIIKQEKPSTIITSQLLASMIDTVDQTKKITVKSFGITSAESLYLNRVEIPIKLGKKSVNITISRNFANRLKQIFEPTMSTFFNFKPQFDQLNHKDSILLLDFNASTYTDLLTSLSKLNMNILLLNERIPAILNLSGLKEIKNSGIKIIRLQDFVNPNLKNMIIGAQNELQNKLKKMHADKFIEKLFLVEGYSVWPSLRDTLVSLCMSRFTDAIQRFELAKELFSKLKIKLILVLIHLGTEEKVILHIAKELKIPTIVLQHGLHVESKTIEQSYLPIVTLRSQTGLKHAAWGHKMKNYLQKFGLSENEIILTGSPRHDRFFSYQKNLKNSNTILLTSGPLGDMDYFGIDTNMYETYKKILEKICSLVHDFENRKLIVKLHRGQPNSYNFEKTITDLDSSILVHKNKDIFELIKDCEILISIDHSTVLLEGMILNKPTILFMVNSKWYEYDEIIHSGATIVVQNVGELENALKKILLDNNFKQNLINKGRLYVNEYLVNRGNSSEFIARWIENYES